MLFVGKLSIKELRWLAVHISLGAVVILDTVFVLLSVGTEILLASQHFMTGSGPTEQFHQLEAIEATFGVFNIVSCFVLVVIAVVKPRLRAKS